MANSCFFGAATKTADRRAWRFDVFCWLVRGKIDPKQTGDDSRDTSAVRARCLRVLRQLMDEAQGECRIMCQCDCALRDAARGGSWVICCVLCCVDAVLRILVEWNMSFGHCGQHIVCISQGSMKHGVREKL